MAGPAFVALYIARTLAVSVAEGVPTRSKFLPLSARTKVAFCRGSFGDSLP